ncbi:FkbM family methyltransferase [Pseudooceanicola sp.]|uniref:FkbM family methyltransferase n=1 Tax=Pseudooceanicola sp. TaxID=1914328 RepID=UPI002621E553|nr:FkbM family methyltransferase [Pseudooceanicola sp.]MDF1854923.1 FkbM family methyltransferase [Pseudooceanicola sp.]
MTWKTGQTEAEHTMTPQSALQSDDAEDGIGGVRLLQPNVTAAPRGVPSFDHMIASNQYGFYCIPQAYAKRKVPTVLRQGQVYEPDTLALMRRKSGLGDVIAGGGFIGDFFPALSEALAATAVLHSFEPNPLSHEAACHTIGLNRLENVCLHPVAVGESPGTLPLLVSRGANNAMAARAKIVADRIEGETIDVPVTTLDNLIGKDRAVSILQLDIEGHELPAVLGAKRIISRNRPMIILEAARRHRQKFYERALNQHFPDIGYRMAGVIERNCIFLPQG